MEERHVLDFVTAASPQELRATLKERGVSPPDVVSIYCQGCAHVAWFQKREVDTKTPEPRKARIRKEAKHGSD